MGREWLVCLLSIILVVLLAACGGAAAPTGSPEDAASVLPARSPAETVGWPTPAETPTSSAAGTPSPGPSVTVSAAPATPTPLPTPEPGGWPVTIDGSWGGEPPFVVGRDGTAYAWINEPGETAVLAAFDTAGRMKPGWPFAAPSGSEPVALDPASDGSVLAGTFDSEAGEFALARLDPDGREMAGWPFRWRSTRRCLPISQAPDGTVFVGRCTDDPATLEIAALDPAGRSIPGWPVRLEDERLRGDWWDAATEVAHDGTVYALVASGRGSDPAARLWALSPDGRARPGWPVTLEASDAGFLLAAAERVLVWSYLQPDGPPGSFDCLEADATVITELDARGRTVAGWPRKEKGWATPPVVADDGAIHYLVRDRAVARRSDGSVRAGWPVRIPGLRPECDATVPSLGPDGTLYVAAGELRAYDPDGATKPGWPYAPDGGLAGWPCHQAATGGPAPAAGPDGVVYLATRAPSADPTTAGQAEITALDARGRVVPGWPFRLPLAWAVGPDGSYLGAAEGQLPGGVRTLGVADGRLYATATVCDPARSGTLLLALEPDGSAAE
jgi:hypothetical protein